MPSENSVQRRAEESVEVPLHGFDSHGTTRARYRGRNIVVEHGIPGEHVRIKVGGGKRLFGHIVDLPEPSADRVEAPCVYFRDWFCGGCQWQHISYERQLNLKRDQLEEAMKLHGLDLRVTAVHALENPWRYRSTAGISLGKRAGFRRHGSLAIVPIRDCLISHPLIGQLMSELNDLIETREIPDFRGRLRLEVRVVGEGEPGTLLILVRPDFRGPPVQSDVSRLIASMRKMDVVQGIAISGEDDSVEVVHGPLYAPVAVAGKAVLVTAASFFQTNLRLLPELTERVLQSARPLTGKRVADIYGGVGVLGLFAALEADHLTVVESNQEATEAARLTAAAWGLNNVRLLNAYAERALEAIAEQDVIIVDPPRTGLSDEVLEAVVARLPPQIVYVSCLPMSLGRDLRVLIDSGYRVEELELFDFYPQTYHVEALAVLRS